MLPTSVTDALDKTLKHRILLEQECLRWRVQSSSGQLFSCTLCVLLDSKHTS